MRAFTQDSSTEETLGEMCKDALGTECASQLHSHLSQVRPVRFLELICIYLLPGGCEGRWKRGRETPSRSGKLMVPPLMSGWGPQYVVTERGPRRHPSVTVERLILNLALIATCSVTISHSRDTTSGVYGCLGNWTAGREVGERAWCIYP